MLTRYAAVQMVAAMTIGLMLTPSGMSGQTQSPGYSLSDLKQMLAGGVRPSRVLALSNESCISFKPGPETDAELSAAGADATLLQGLRTACFRASAPPAVQSAASLQYSDDDKRNLSHALAMISPSALQRIDQIGFVATKVLLTSAFTSDTTYEDNPEGDHSFIKNDRIYLESRKKGYANVRGWDRTYDDVLIRYTMRWESGEPGAFGGMRFRRTTNDDNFLLSTTNGSAAEGGMYSFDKRTSAGWSELTPNTKTATIHEGDNVIEIAVVGSTATLYINGLYVATTTGISLSTGNRLDMFVNSGAVFSFKDVVLLALGAK